MIKPGASRAKMKSAARLVSLDAFRGFIMTMLAANGFGLLAFSRIAENSPVWQSHDRAFWQQIAFHFDHPAWRSAFDTWKVSFWDLIQPAFMFMVGVSMPFSDARRETQGQSVLQRGLHAMVRSVVLVLMGVFLYSMGHQHTNWIFPNVLCQIGLGYFFAWLLLNRGVLVQTISIAVLLVGYGGWFWMNPPPAGYDYDAVSASKDKGEVFEGRFAAWSKNANAAFLFDQWLLPKLRSVPDAPDESTGGAGILWPPTGWQVVSLPQNVTAPVDTTTPDATPVADPAKPESASAADTPVESAAPADAVPPETVPSAQTSGKEKSETATDEPVKPTTPGWFRQWFLSNPEPYEFNKGGYTTLNFVPSIATTLLGILCGQLLMNAGFGRWEKLGILIISAGLCLGLGIAADLTICPVVKRIWTPSWVLFSGGYVIGMLALFYFLFDIAPLKFLAFPLVVVGMNSILIYMLGQTVSGWMRENVVKVHLSGVLTHVFGPKALDPQWFGPITLPTTVFLLYWLFLLWLYRQKIFLRI